jgi:hypothetical protein
MLRQASNICSTRVGSQDQHLDQGPPGIHPRPAEEDVADGFALRLGDALRPGVGAAQVVGQRRDGRAVVSSSGR